MIRSSVTARFLFRSRTASTVRCRRPPRAGACPSRSTVNGPRTPNERGAIGDRTLDAWSVSAILQRPSVECSSTRLHRVAAGLEGGDMRSRTTAAVLLTAGAALLAPAQASAAASTFAVVDPGGALVRGSIGAASAHLAPGEYLVRFPRAVSRCAYNATVGNVRTGPYLP